VGFVGLLDGWVRRFEGEDGGWLVQATGMMVEVEMWTLLVVERR
jgi:hypothetical protein